MEIDEINYDIDNVDIEAEMNAADIEGEIAEMEEERAREEDEKAEKELIKQSKKLTAKNINDDLKYHQEIDRRHYLVKYNDVKYEIVVLYKINDDEYLFTTRMLNEDEWKTRKFKFSELLQVK